MDRIIISITNDRRAEASGRFFAGDTCEVQIRGLPEGADAAGLRFALLTPGNETAAQCFDFNASYVGTVALTTNEIQAMLLNVPAGRNVEVAMRVWTTDGEVLASGFARLVSLPVADPPRYVTMEYLEQTLTEYATKAYVGEAVAGLASEAFVSSSLSSAVDGLASETFVSSSVSSALALYATSAQTSAAIQNALAPYALQSTIDKFAIYEGNYVTLSAGSVSADTVSAGSVSASGVSADTVSAGSVSAGRIVVPDFSSRMRELTLIWNENLVSGGGYFLGCTL